MDEERFNLIFKGELVPGFELAVVKKNLAVLFRIDAQKVDLLFSGKEIPLKKELDATAANKYRVALKKAGVRVNVVPSEVPPSPVQTIKSRALQEAQAKKQSFKPLTEAKPGLGDATFETALGAQAIKPDKPREAIKAPDFGISKVGEDLLKETEKQPIAAVEVDTSYLSVAPQKGNLLVEGEIKKAEPVAVKDLQAELLPSGSDLLKPEERPKVERVEVDVSSLSLAKVGERLSEKKTEDPPAPNVDHIRLAD